MLIVLLGLVFWFFVIRWLIRLGCRHPQASLGLIRGLVGLIRR